MYLLNNVLPGRYMPVRVTRGIPRSHIGILMQKGKVLYGQEPPSGESTTTYCVVNYQLVAVTTVVAQWGTPSSQPATDNGVRDGRSNCLSHPPPSFTVLPELHVLHGVKAANKSQDLVHQPELEHASTGMPDQSTTCAELRV